MTGKRSKSEPPRTVSSFGELKHLDQGSQQQKQSGKPEALDSLGKCLNPKCSLTVYRNEVYGYHRDFIKNEDRGTCSKTCEKAYEASKGQEKQTMAGSTTGLFSSLVATTA